MEALTLFPSWFLSNKALPVGHISSLPHPSFSSSHQKKPKKQTKKKGGVYFIIGTESSNHLKLRCVEIPVLSANYLYSKPPTLGNLFKHFFSIYSGVFSTSSNGYLLTEKCLSVCRQIIFCSLFVPFLLRAERINVCLVVGVFCLTLLCKKV